MLLDNNCTGMEAITETTVTMAWCIIGTPDQTACNLARYWQMFCNFRNADCFKILE